MGITKAATSARPAELVELGLLKRRPYREPGQRIREEYVLTQGHLVARDEPGMRLVRSV